MKGVEEYHGDINAFKDDTFDLENQKYKNNQNLKKFEIFNKRFQYILAKDKEILKQIDSILIFDNYRRELHFYEMISAIAGNKSLMELVGNENLNRNRIFENTENDYKVLLYKILIVFRLYQLELYESRKELAKKSFKKAENQTQKIVKEIIQDFKKIDFTDEIFFKINELINKYDKKSELYSKKNINNILDNYKYIDNDIWIEKSLTPISTEFNIGNPLLQLLKTKNIVRTEFINSLDNSYNYFMLSSGERNYIEIFVTYIYHLIIQNTKEINRKFLFLFDEIDLGLHPNWQKRLIRDIISFTNGYFDYPIQLILTSHSPFLLSDIPKQNIIFLDKDPNGSCIVTDGLKEKKQTFGANIHTLLSDSFFMEDGLMGEFAKGKIDEVIDYLNNKDTKIKDDEQAQQLIDIIGEPIVKNQLQQMLDSKRLSKVDKIDKIEEEILALQNELKGLRDGQK